MIVYATCFCRGVVLHRYALSLYTHPYFQVHGLSITSNMAHVYMICLYIAAYFNWKSDNDQTHYHPCTHNTNSKFMALWISNIKYAAYMKWSSNVWITPSMVHVYTICL